MMFSATPIEAQDLRLTYADPNAGCAVVQWQSSAPAATKIIFAEFTSEPISIALTEENFGYPFGTPQNNAGLASHTAILEGLEPGKNILLPHSYQTSSNCTASHWRASNSSRRILRYQHNS